MVLRSLRELCFKSLSTFHYFGKYQEPSTSYLTALIFQMLQKCNNAAFPTWYDVSHPISHHIPASPKKTVAEKELGKCHPGHAGQLPKTCMHEHSSCVHTSPWSCSCQQKSSALGRPEHPEGNPRYCKALQAGFGEGEWLASQE